MLRREHGSNNSGPQPAQKRLGACYYIDVEGATPNKVVLDRSRVGHDSLCLRVHKGKEEIQASIKPKENIKKHIDPELTRVIIAYIVLYHYLHGGNEAIVADDDKNHHIPCVPKFRKRVKPLVNLVIVFDSQGFGRVDRRMGFP